MFEDKKHTIQSIVNVFETGKPVGDYAAVAIHKDGAGVSYGRSQATDKGGNLDAILLRYLELNGTNASLVRPFLSVLAENETAKIDPDNPPLWTRSFVAILKKIGNENTMKRAQDEIFDQEYWRPAQKHCMDMCLSTPLAAAVVYDTCIHSGPRGVWRIRHRFAERPPVNGGNEKKWVKAYLKARRAWLANYPNPIVQRTVYRMDAFENLIAQDNWNLDTPFRVRNQTIR